MDSSIYDYTERPKQFSRKDFWRQVRRTINGEPIGEDQLFLIENQIKNKLKIKQHDNVLDVGCGNGALLSRILSKTNVATGIDQSEYLIEIANENFATENINFICLSVVELLKTQLNMQSSKCLIYGVSSFLEDDLLSELIRWAFYGKIEKMLIGNVRNRDKAGHFFSGKHENVTLDDTTSSMGKWRTKKWFSCVARQHSLRQTFSSMPSNFYANEYYFDVVLEN